MSSDSHAFDGLGRIFATGGEQSFALAVARGYSPSRIDSIMERRYGDDYRSAGGTLAAFAAGMLLAGNRANQAMETGEELDGSIIPRNEFLPDDEMGGSRYKWAADVTFEGANAAVTVYFYTAGLDINSALDDAISGGSDIVDNYRQKFGISEIADLTPLSVEFISIQSGY
jgi:hypothetical protein